MKFNTDDTRIAGMAEVRDAQALLDEIPLSEQGSSFVFNTRKACADILRGNDPRLLVVVGPCSIHDPVAAMEYAQKLAAAAQQWRDQLLILMRVYFEKPRTTVGWKGLINDPHLNDSFDINAGLATARRLLRDITELGLGSGTEYLDPITPQYIGDLVCWSAIGARTTESQIHRQLASGLSCPVGFKNSTLGDVQVAVDAVLSARHNHIFPSVTKAGHSAIFSTTGNDDCHVILRGGREPNFDAASVQAGCDLLAAAGLPPRLMVDLSHANSSKDHERQKIAGASIAEQLQSAPKNVMGVMIESHLVAGRQSLGDDLVYGQSVTDACIGWDDTLALLDQLAAAKR
ncbi:MAG: 3-deoxy-7-phosphoheptulonate synthase [Gammaproteobacteria bacterium]|nr:3-deoxy-7-phosphoheptulonate synthase [Gammaproteobacteria bacterium]